MIATTLSPARAVPPAARRRHDLAFFDEHRSDRRGERGLDAVLHLHRLEHDQQRVFFDREPRATAIFTILPGIGAVTRPSPTPAVAAVRSIVPTAARLARMATRECRRSLRRRT